MAVTNIEDRLYSVLCNVANEHGSIGPKGLVIQFPLTHEVLKKAGKAIHEDRKHILPVLK